MSQITNGATYTAAQFAGKAGFDFVAREGANLKRNSSHSEKGGEWIVDATTRAKNAHGEWRVDFWTSMSTHGYCFIK